MTAVHALCRSIVLALILFWGFTTLPADATGTTWTVTSNLDTSVGDTTAHTGTLRFILANAQSGDRVVFGDVPGSDAIFVGSTLTVPAGVNVGASRDEPCGSASTPRRNLRATNASVGPLLTLAASSTLRGVTVSGGESGVRVTGPNVEICAVGFGVWVDGDGNTISEPAVHAALIVDGSAAWVHRSYLGGSAVVTVNGSDSVLGDTLSSNGESNSATTSMALTIAAGPNGAAQRVTVRDGYTRGLQGLQGSGVSGGDDAIDHANNWVLTPQIGLATADGSVVSVSGMASPGSLIDMYSATVPPQRFATVSAASDGTFLFTGVGPAAGTEVYAVSTLNDPAHPNRRGSSSQLSARVTIVAGAVPATSTPTNTTTPTPSATATPTASTTPTVKPGATMTVTPTRFPDPTPLFTVRCRVWMPRLSAPPKV